MTKIEVLAIRGVLIKLQALRKEPKLEWMADEYQRGKEEAFDTAEKLVAELLTAAKETSES